MDIRKVSPEVYAAWLREQGVPQSELVERVARDMLLGMLATAREVGIPTGFEDLFKEAQEVASQSYLDNIRTGRT